MQENIKTDLVYVLKETIKSLKYQDLQKLRELSNRTVHNSSIYQERFSISVSVVIYSLFKILEKEENLENENWPYIKRSILLELNIAINAIKKEKTHLLSKSLKKIVLDLKNLDKQTGRFMQEAVETSKIKKAYGIYRHGISLGKAAELLGISRWELQPYLGKTRESESLHELSKPVQERIRLAKIIFNVK